MKNGASPRAHHQVVKKAKISSPALRVRMPFARHYGRARAEAMVAPLINKGDEKMAQAIGYVTETDNGFTGQLAMMSLKKRITIMPNSNKDKRQDSLISGSIQKTKLKLAAAGTGSER